MIGNIDNLWLFFSILLASIITYIFWKLQNTRFDSFFILFFNISIYIYCGYGISGVYVPNKYYGYFFIFIIAIDLSYTITSRLMSGMRNQRTNNEFNNFFRQGNWLVVIVFIFFVTLFLPLIFPTLRLNELFSPPAANTQFIFLKRAASNSNVFLYIGKTLQLLLLPFFLVYIKILIENKKNFRWVLLYVVFVYLKYLEFDYVARNELIGYLGLFIVMFMSIKNFPSKKLFLISGIVIILIIGVPFLVKYQESRIGGSAVKSNYIGYINILLSSEGYYPEYYNLILNIGRTISPLNYLLWIIFLVIPNKILPFKPTLAINDVFTYQVTGLQIGDHLYSIQLPSLLGESFMIYGNYFFWIHAVFLGAFSAALFTLYKKYPTLNFWLVYMAISFIKIPRGGSQGSISETLNGSMGLIIAFFLYRIISVLRRQKGASL